MAGSDDETTPRHRPPPVNLDEIGRRLSKNSDALAMFKRDTEEELGEITERLVEIHGRSGKNGRLGELHAKVEAIDENMKDGFVEVAKMLETQNKGAVKALAWTVGLIVVPVIVAAVALYQRIAVLETLVKIVR